MFSLKNQSDLQEIPDADWNENNNMGELRINNNYKTQKASGYTRDERHRLRNAALRLMKDMRKGKEKEIN